MYSAGPRKMIDFSASRATVERQMTLSLTLSEQLTGMNYADIERRICARMTPEDVRRMYVTDTMNNDPIDLRSRVRAALDRARESGRDMSDMRAVEIVGDMCNFDGELAEIDERVVYPHVLEWVVENNHR